MLEFSTHCKDRMKERGIDEELVLKTIFKPEQITNRDNRFIFHRRYRDEIKNKEYLLRVFVEKDEENTEVISVYKTSKIEKYWRLT